MNKEIVSIISNAEYQSSEGVSKSKLDLAHKTPALIEWRENAPEDPAKLETFNMGHAVHCSILEPDRYERDYIAAPNVDKRTKAGKQEWAEFLESSSGQTVLTDEEYTKVGLIRDSALAHPDFKRLHRSNFIAEGSIFWTDKRSGLLCKVRPDFMLKDHPIILDVKTTADISRFDRSIAVYRYHVQDAHYSEGAMHYYGETPDFIFLVVSTTISGGRYPVRMFTLTESDKAQGMRERNEDLNTIAQCEIMNEWPGLETISLPSWARDDQYKMEEYADVI